MNAEISFLIKSSEQGNVDSQKILALCFENGTYVKKDDKKAIYWFEQAAKQNDALSQNKLGYAYQYGKGVKSDIKKAIEWYQKSANQGNSDAQNNLGYCYKYGKGVQKNIQKALEMFEKSALLGNPAAENNLGCCYYNGDGVEKNEKKAMQFFEKAAAKGHTDCQFFLGNYYEDRKEYGRAILYYNQCLKIGDSERLISANTGYFAAYLSIKEEEIQTLKNENLKLKEENEELRYVPGNPGYNEAKRSFESLSTTKLNCSSFETK